MNEIGRRFEIKTSDCSLLERAKSMEGSDTKTSDLDKPIAKEIYAMKRHSLEGAESKTEVDEIKREGLTSEERLKIKEVHKDWPDEIINSIGSMEEYKVYDNANLQIEYVNDTLCLIRSDIDLNQIDADGISNKQRMARGLPPMTGEGKIVELHLIGQRSDSPLAELTTDEHRGAGNDGILHNKTQKSEINRPDFSSERQEHWKSRSSMN